MKKTIALLAILLVSISLFGQRIDRAAFIERQSHWVETMNLPVGDNGRQQAETLEEQIYDYGFQTELGNSRISYAHFISNGRIFLISYEPLSDRVATDVPVDLKNVEVIEAELYLYSKDLSKPKSKWEIASVEKIMDNYKPANLLVNIYIATEGYTGIDTHMYGDDSNIGKVIELQDNRVEITVETYKFLYGKGVVESEIQTFVFTPVDNKHYAFNIK